MVGITGAGVSKASRWRTTFLLTTLSFLCPGLRGRSSRRQLPASRTSSSMRMTSQRHASFTWKFLAGNLYLRRGRSPGCVRVSPARREATGAGLLLERRYLFNLKWSRDGLLDIGGIDKGADSEEHIPGSNLLLCEGVLAAAVVDLGHVLVFIHHEQRHKARGMTSR